MAGRNNAHLVVMAGGSGTRFWPKSTAKKPKQLLAFGKDPKRSLLLDTLERFNGLVPEGHRWIVTTRTLEGAVKESVPASTRVLAESVGKNTAPCIYWAAREIASTDPKAVMLVMPSDHYIPLLAEFRATVERAVEWAARNDDLVTLGVTPTRAETGYGYLQLGDAVSGSTAARRVAKFVEKPDAARAEAFFKSGQYLWNAGMFVWRAEVVLRAFDQYMPAMREVWNAAGAQADAAYANLPASLATSIDFGLMEKAERVVTFALDCGWDDLGSWTSLDSLGDALNLRRSGGVVIGGDLIAVESERNIVDVPGRCVALLGVSDLIVVEHGGALLVAHKDRAQDIRKIVERVKAERPDLA